MMSKKISNREIVIVNQASNYLTVGICNAFAARFDSVCLITGSVHVQGEELADSVKVQWINHWIERPAYKKLFSYMWACIQVYGLLIFRYRRSEVFFVSIPPMAYLLTIILPNRCSMLIWDVYPDIFKITGLKETHPVYRTWARLNKIAFKKAYRVFTIGERMAGLLKKYTGTKKVFVTPLWSIFQENERVERAKNFFLDEHGIRDKFIVQYSGNIGLTHNVEVMVELAELMKNHTEILFQIIGRGPREPHLKALVKERSLPNCRFLPFQSDEMFPYSLSAADVGVVILDKTTSKGSVPSKSYNLMSYGIPALYIASDDSELHDYAERYGHAISIDPEKLNEAADFILTLKNCQQEWKQFSKNALTAATYYRRSNADDIAEMYINGDSCTRSGMYREGLKVNEAKIAS